MENSEEGLIVTTSNHGESLDEHNYWGHGKNLFEPGLWIPLLIFFLIRFLKEELFQA